MGVLPYAAVVLVELLDEDEAEEDDDEPDPESEDDDEELDDFDAGELLEDEPRLSLR